MHISWGLIIFPLHYWAVSVVENLTSWTTLKFEEYKDIYCIIIYFYPWKNCLLKNKLLQYITMTATLWIRRRLNYSDLGFSTYFSTCFSKNDQSSILFLRRRKCILLSWSKTLTKTQHIEKQRRYDSTKRLVFGLCVRNGQFHNRQSLSFITVHGQF